MADRFFLPDFCTARSVVTVVVVAQLTAFLLTLARPVGAEPWTDLLRLSLFLQWIALVSAGVLCLCRGWLASLPPRRSVGVAFALLVAAAVALAEAAWWTAQLSGIGVGLVPVDRAEFLLRTFGLALIISALVLRYLWLQHQWRERVRSEASTRFAALQARIRPHFLFNSMNTIAALTRNDPDAAEQVTEDLADLFRAALAETGSRVCLRDELALCRRYARIESLRLGERLRVDWKVDALPGDALIPGLVLQPLLENAIYHGVEPAIGGATVAVSGSRDGNSVTVEVRNPLPPDRTRPQHGLRIALENVTERLALAFPGAGTLETLTDDGDFVVVIGFRMSPAMQILIVDDEAPARARLARLVADAGHSIVGEAADGIAALEAVQQLAPQVVLMDVRMPGMDGLEVARHLATLDTPPAVVFTTAYDEYALAAFDAAAVAYLLKPVRAERLADALERAARPTRAQLTVARTHLSSRMGDRLLLVPVESVRCLLADSKYVTARHDKGELVLDETLKSLESEFPERFLRIHRNALVAVDHVDRIEGNLVFLIGDSEPLEVSRRHGAEVRRRLQRA